MIQFEVNGIIYVFNQFGQPVPIATIVNSTSTALKP